MTAILQNPIFQDEILAREWLEARVWANGRLCPHCGVMDQSTALKGKVHREPDLKCGFAEVPASIAGMAGRDWRGKPGAFVTALHSKAAKNSQKANFESGAKHHPTSNFTPCASGSVRP